jgi:polygalacturonase/pectin methylesterase-like acyl-CoA thioesterase
MVKGGDAGNGIPALFSMAPHVPSQFLTPADFAGTGLFSILFRLTAHWLGAEPCYHLKMPFDPLMKLKQTLWLFSHLSLCGGFLAIAMTAQAQKLINVKPATGALTAPTGPAAIGASGDLWNAFGNLPSTGGTLTNASTIIDSSGATVSGATMTLSINGTSLSGYSSTAYGANPSAIMSTYLYDGNGDYFTVVFSGLPANKAYLIYGLGTGNAQGQGTTWWADTANGHGTATATANFTSGSPLGTRDATQATNQGVCWVGIPATTTVAGALTFRACKLGATESGGVVSGGSGRAYFNGFQLLPLSAPAISGLTNQTVVAGTAASLNPANSGVPVPSYQWCSNSLAITGATNASLTLYNVQFAQNGTVYSLVASNYVGAVTNSMTLTVIVTPGITGLNNQAVPTGSTATLAATVSGVPTPATFWQLNGTNLNDGATGNGSTLSGSATSTLVITNAQAADTGTYSLVATNSAGIVTNRLTLTVASGNVAPGITGPANQTVVQTSSATFSVSVSGLPVPSLQWWVNGTVLSGQTNSSLTVSNVQYSQNGYACALVASNSLGQATNTATLSVLVPPVISQPPTNLTVVTGNPAVFSLTAGGVPAVNYQWNRNGSPIANATNATYTLTSAQGADNGAVFSVTVTNSVGTATSGGATLTVLSTMTGTFLPTNGAANLSPDQQLRIVFSSPPVLNTNGVLTLRDAANNSVVATIDSSQFLSYLPGNTSIQTIPNAAIRSVEGESYYYMPIAIYGNEAWITFTNRLSYGHVYYANCDAGLFLDTNGASFSGIAGTNTWYFSTKASGPATPTVSTGPATITIGQDGSGDFASFQGAFDWIPQNNTLARTIHVLPGLYRDNASLAQNRNFVTIVGDGASRTNAQLIYPFAFFAPPNTLFTAGSLRIESSDVAVLNLTLDNLIYNVYHPTGNASSGAAGAFAGAINTLATTGNRIVFDNVLIKGGQDTIYNISGIVYYTNCEVWGSVDFIYGPALGVFDQCNIVEIRNTGGPCTAPNTGFAQPYGMTFLNCTFPQAFVTNGYPYDVGAATTTFMRPWGKDGMTAAINCAIGSQFSTMGYQTFGNTNEDECRARESGTTLIGGGTAPTIGQRQAAGTYWVNTIDPDYTNNPSLLPADPLLAPPTGTNNRVAVTINPGDYTLSAIFGNSYFNLNGWLPAVSPVITSQPTNQTIAIGSNAAFSVAATGLPAPACQWLKNGTNYPGATNATLTITNVQPSDAAGYSVVVSNSSGTVTSSNATLTVSGNPPVFTTQPTNQTVALGGTAVFVAAASGVPAPAYQWLKSGAGLPNATNATLTLTNVQITDLGVYSLIAANTFGSAAGSYAALTVTGGVIHLPAINLGNLLPVTNSSYDAVGDGVTDNTAAIQSAINAAAKGGVTNGLRGGTVEIPAPGVFLCGPLNFSNNVNLQIDAGAVLRLLPYGTWPGSPYTGTVPPLVSGSGLTNLAVTGAGLIDGQGAPWWLVYATNNRPVIIDFSSCSEVLLQNFTSSNPPVAHIAIKGANAGNISLIGVSLLAPDSSAAVTPSHNTDGVDFAETNALFQNCTISTGDDNLAFGSSGSVTRDILVTNCFFGYGHGCSIGSFTSGGVSNLTVTSCTFSNTGNGIKIKSERDRGGVVQNCGYYNLTMTNVGWPIQIYAYYEYGLGTLSTLTSAFVAATAFTSTNPVPYSPPIYRNLTFSNLTANVPNGEPPLLIWGLPDYPASNIVFKNITLNSSSTSVSAVYNSTNLLFTDCTFGTPSGVATLAVWNANLTVSNRVAATNLIFLNGLTTNSVGSTLAFNNALATLQNTNAIAGGAITLNNGTLTVSNNLRLTPANPLNFNVGTNPALLAVKGNLNLGGVAPSGGIVNVAAGNAFTNGTYTLITYAGTLGGTLPVLGSTPPGCVCTLDTNTVGQVNVIVTPPPPGIPTNLTASVTNLLVNLNWLASSNTTGYLLERSLTNNGPYSLLTTLAPTHYADASVAPGTTYYYVVAATNGGAQSGNSVQVSAVPLPSAAPTNLTCQADDTQFQLGWPQDHLGWRLESQTNAPGAGLGANWTPVTGSSATNRMWFPLSPGNGSVFYRLTSP